MAELPWSETGFQAQGAALLARDGGCAVWRLRNESGEGTITACEVFPGVMLSFNDLHMGYYDCDFSAGRELLVIDHCREGRMEYCAGRDALAYQQAGDLKLDRRRHHTGRFSFPTSHYHGLTAALDAELAARSLPEAFRDFPADPRALIEKFRLGEYPRVFHNAERIEHIFGELYQAPQKLRLPLFRLKVLELLLFLDAMEPPEDDGRAPYFCRTQVEKARAIRAFLAEHPAQRHTQEALSRRFGIALTPMKSCFRAVYGQSIGSWLTRCRMDRAAELLLADRSLSIADAAAQVGYESPSKFTAAFRRVMGRTPSE